MEIPDMWLVGCTAVYERNGLTPKEALMKAIECWIDLDEAHKQWMLEKEDDRV